MVPKKHILLGLIFSVLIYFILKLNLIQVSIIFLSSVLIDFDHVIYYFFKKKNLNPKKAINYYFKKKEKLEKLSIEEKRRVYWGFYCFHGIEIVIILFLLGFFISNYFYFVLIGVTFHLVLDYIHQLTNHLRFDKVSIFWDYFKFRKLKEI